MSNSSTGAGFPALGFPGAFNNYSNQLDIELPRPTTGALSTASSTTLSERVEELVPGVKLDRLRATLERRSRRPLTHVETLGWLVTAIARLETILGRPARYTDVVSLAAQSSADSRVISSAASAGGLDPSGYAASLIGDSVAQAASGRGTDKVPSNSRRNVHYPAKGSRS